MPEDLKKETETTVTVPATDEVVKASNNEITESDTVEVVVIKETDKIKKAIESAKESSGHDILFQGNAVFASTQATALDENTIACLVKSDSGTHGEAIMKVFTTEKEVLEYLANYGK